MAAEFDSFLIKLESQGLVLAQDPGTKRAFVLSVAELEARRSRGEEAQERREAAAAAAEAFVEPIPPSARVDEEEEKGEEEAVVAVVAPLPLPLTSSPGGRLLLQSGTAGGSLGGSAPLTAPVSSGRNPQLGPGQQAAFAAAGGTNGTTSAPAQGSGAGTGRPGGGGRGGSVGGGGGANRPTDPANFLYSGPAVGVTVPNSIARVLPQYPASFNGTRPIVQTNPLSLLANGVYQGNIYSGGTSRSPGLATVPTPTPPAPAMVYRPGDPINVVIQSSGISPLINANSALSVVSNWPFNNFRNNFPNQNVGSAGSLRTLFCATPLTQWCTNTLPIDPSLVNSVFQSTQNPNFLLG